MFMLCQVSECPGENTRKTGSPEDIEDILRSRTLRCLNRSAIQCINWRQLILTCERSHQATNRKQSFGEVELEGLSLCGTLHQYT